MIQKDVSAEEDFKERRVGCVGEAEAATR